MRLRHRHQPRQRCGRGGEAGAPVRRGGQGGEPARRAAGAHHRAFADDSFAAPHQHPGSWARHSARSQSVQRHLPRRIGQCAPCHRLRQHRVFVWTFRRRCVRRWAHPLPERHSRGQPRVRRRGARRRPRRHCHGLDCLQPAARADRRRDVPGARQLGGVPGGEASAHFRRQQARHSRVRAHLRSADHGREPEQH